MIRGMNVVGPFKQLNYTEQWHLLRIALRILRLHEGGAIFCDAEN